MFVRDRLARCSLFLALVTVAPFAFASDWPQYRGPHQDGRVDTGSLPETFDLELAWRVPMGSGYSSVSVLGDRGVVLHADGTHDVATAFDVATGKIVWRYEISEMYKGHSGSDDGPIATPALVDGIVYGLGARGHLFAVRLADGVLVWQRSVVDVAGGREPFYGFATTPLVTGHVVVVQTGGTTEAAEGRVAGGAVTAFDRATGDVVWHQGSDAVQYQSPVLATLAGREQVITISDAWMMGLDPTSGTVLWRHEHGLSSIEAFSQAVPIDDQRFVANSLDEVVMFGIEAMESGGEYSVSEVWRSKALKNAYVVPVYHDGHLYGFSGTILNCVDASTGEMVWRSRPPGGEGLIVVDGHVAIVGGDGALVLADAASDEYREVARLSIFEKVSSTAPSFAHGMFLVRDLEDLAAVRVVEASAPPLAEPASDETAPDETVPDESPIDRR